MLNINFSLMINFTFRCLIITVLTILFTGIVLNCPAQRAYVCAKDNNSSEYFLVDIDAERTLTQTAFTNSVLGMRPIGIFDGAGSTDEEPFGISVNPRGTRTLITKNKLVGQGSVLVIDNNSLCNNQLDVGEGPRGVAQTLDGTLAFVANYRSGDISVIDLTIVDQWCHNLTNPVNPVLGSIPLPNNAKPYGIVIDLNDSRVFVTNSGNNSISVIDISLIRDWFASQGSTTHPVITNFPSVINSNTNSTPKGIKFSPDGCRLFIANWGSNEVSVVSPSRIQGWIDSQQNPLWHPVVNTFSVEQGPVDLEVTPSGDKLFVVSQAANKVSIFDLDNYYSNIYTVDLTNEGADPRGIDITPDGTQAFIPMGSSNSGRSKLVSVYQINTPQVSYGVTSVELITRVNGVITKAAIGSTIAFGNFIIDSKPTKVTLDILGETSIGFPNYSYLGRHIFSSDVQSESTAAQIGFKETEKRIQYLIRNPLLIDDDGIPYMDIHTNNYITVEIDEFEGLIIRDIGDVDFYQTILMYGRKIDPIGKDPIPLGDMHLNLKAITGNRDFDGFRITLGTNHSVPSFSCNILLWYSVPGVGNHTASLGKGIPPCQKRIDFDFDDFIAKEYPINYEDIRGIFIMFTSAYPSNSQLSIKSMELY